MQFSDYIMGHFLLAGLQCLFNVGEVGFFVSVGHSECLLNINVPFSSRIDLYSLGLAITSTTLKYSAFISEVEQKVLPRVSAIS